MPKNHRLNTDFQILYFLAGSCHTPDGAYALLCDLREDRANAIKHYEVQTKRAEAKRLRAQTQLAMAMDDATRLEAEADLQELANGEVSGKVHYEAALAELAFIDSCMAKLEPLRKYAHLPLPEAHEASQREEWRAELMRRAENYLLTTGTIPPDHFETMRQHPDFREHIFPWIEHVKLAMKNDRPDRLLAPSPVLKLLSPRSDST